MCRIVGAYHMGNALMAPSRIMPPASLSGLAVLKNNADSVDSAFCALTDFQEHYPIIVEIDSCIEDALAEMKTWGVHALLVTHQEIGGIDLQVIGLITHYDIESRHRRYANTASREYDRIVRVGEVMTAWNELILVKYEALRTLTTHDLRKTFQRTGLTHLLVVEFGDEESVVARGLLSQAALAKHLNGSSLL
jgi:hypothetical protein